MCDRTVFSWLRVLAVAVALIGLATPVVAAGAAADLEDLSQLKPFERRQQLRPIYEAIQNDVQYNALRGQLDGNMDNQEVIDRYLRFLPISPLELLEIDMQARRYEHVIPRFMQEWHRRWIELHQEVARKIYGAQAVEHALARQSLDRGVNISTETDESGEVITRAVTVGTNRNMAATASITPDDYQGEIQLVVNPNNTNQIVAAANTFDNANGTCAADTQAIFYSSNGGTTWGYTCAPNYTAYGLSCSGTPFGSDPALAWNNSGEVFIEYMMLCLGSNTQYSIVIAKSTNGGATWSAQGIIKNSYSTPGQIEDKQFLSIDTYSGSPYNGRMYTCWDRNNNEKFAYSTNGGTSWTEVDLPAPSGGGFDLGCDIAVQDNGTVHVVFNTLTCGASCTNERMHYTRSTNGGASWSTPVLVRDFNLTGFSGTHCPDAQDNRCIGPFGSIDVDNSGGSCDNTLYTTFTDYSSGGVNNSDVWVSRSTNNGASWSSPILVNDDGISNRVQFHPFLEVDQTNGTPVVAWHDARNDSGNDAVDFYVSRSTDCGLSWQANVQASQASSEFNNSTISYTNENTADNPGRNPNQYGEYLGLDAHNGKAYLAWVDTRHFHPGSTTNVQKENVGFAVVDFGTVSNTAPVVTITAPTNGSSFTQGASVSFSGTATDAEDGSLTSSLSWSSSINGTIGSGGSFSTSGLSVGTHTITASVTDSGSLPGSDAISVTINSAGGGSCTSINFNSITTTGYAGQDISANFAVQDAGATFFEQANTWRRSTNTYNITANTVLNFEFQSTSQGEIHGIGFDENNTLADAVRIFQLFGTQNWSSSNHDYDDYVTTGTYKSYSIPVGTYYTGSAMYLAMTNDKDSGTLNNTSYFRNVEICEPAPPSCTVDEDFEAGASGWTTSGTCSTGTFILGTPTLVTDSGVTTQPSGASSGSNALFTATNSSAGVNDVDGGECVLTSPTWNVSSASSLNVDFFHGQRDAGDDPSGDYFVLEYRINGGAWTTLNSFGDVTVNAAWTASNTASVPASSTVQLRVRVSDGSGPGDLVEAGIDDVSVCAN